MKLEKDLLESWKNYNNACIQLYNHPDILTNNFVGEFAELLVCKLYNGIRAPASTKDYDIICPNGDKIQVKSRRFKSNKLYSESLGIIRGNKNKLNFDYLVVVLFNEKGELLKGIKIQSKYIKDISKHNKYQNGEILYTNNELLNNQNTSDITNELKKLI